MNNLKSLRLSAKITQRALAKEMRVTQGAIAHYESGRRVPSLSGCRRIVHALERLGVRCSLSTVFPDQVERSADLEPILPSDSHLVQCADAAVQASSMGAEQ
ncbi:TPA: helix-turn-helix transcriptional regulator [Pseudomonas aeruginosa]|uniref:helix-turn-helix transcriptional regulator n=1 Tax=Pseudomonas aeruginosa TaxID=287 RepID=UPI000D96E2A6|nr:helix-turn-helix transcriptional regulator [Pseudomonas aeruginosa]MCO2927945.1 XRE family transcriptional regulator [Pseudomonas aeruginosa]RMJ65975.1 hypothetical protein IPC1268_34635 [Pseudomonas aeruginosa]RPW72576.1 hypothetical protein IPC734_32865 [Pseudomonas aeruginosa]TQH88765.1 helix-turn-helix transcriptional regulator [Pseudomonas aeruginosa]TQI08212.1 helix-turn-helix transcriptional regulator [Pseudomonas aeruginosa]